MTWFVNILADYHWLYWITDWNFSVAFCLQRPWSWSQDLGVTVSVFILKHKCEGLGLVLEISEKVLTTTLKSIQSVNVFPSSRSPTERCLLLHLQWICRMTHECMPQQQAARQKYPPNDFCILAQSYQSLSRSQVACQRFEVLNSYSSSQVQKLMVGITVTSYSVRTFCQSVNPSTPAVPNCCCLMGSLQRHTGLTHYF